VCIGVIVGGRVNGVMNQLINVWAVSDVPLFCSLLLVELESE
jgi:hypothetical protein